MMHVSTTLLRIGQSTLTAAALILAIVVLFNSIHQIQSSRGYSFNVTCNVISASDRAIVNAVALSDGFYTDPGLKRFLQQPGLLTKINRFKFHLPTPAEEAQYNRSIAKVFGLYLTNAVVKSVGAKGAQYVYKDGTINCAALRRAVVH